MENIVSLEIIGVMSALVFGIVVFAIWITRVVAAKDMIITQQKSEIYQLQEEHAKLLKSSATLQKEIDSLDRSVDALQESNKNLSIEKATAEANLMAQKLSSEKLKVEFEEQGKKLELKLNAIMQNSLDGKIKKFDDTSVKALDTLLKPFKENLDSFGKKVENTQETTTKKFAELSKEIEQITKAGMNISKEAENLANALKSKKQMQGAWGEMILESVLESSGLLKGQHYETQTSYKDEAGVTKRPDVIIKLPQNRSIIIDSKVSLNDYNDYIRANSDEERILYAQKTLQAFKEQIDNLASKDYAHYKIGTLQYVFMFVPIEGAFALALQQDPTLYEYALKRHIAIVNPSTLTVSLHTIYLYWQSEQSNSLASKLFDEAGKLYDKMYIFSESFSRVGSQIQTLSKTYETGHKQLSEGSGNLLGRVENLKKLGARTSKKLSSQKIEFQELNLDDVEVEIVEELEVLEHSKDEDE